MKADVPMQGCATPRKLALLALPLALLLAAAAPAGAETQTSQPLPSFPHATMVSGAALQGADLGTADGMRAAIDPRTGEMRQPSRAELRALAAEESRQPSRVFAASTVEMPDGTVMMALDGALLNYSLARLDGAGHATFTCVDGPAQADRELFTVPATAGEEK